MGVVDGDVRFFIGCTGKTLSTKTGTNRFLERQRREWRLDFFIGNGTAMCGHVANRYFAALINRLVGGIWVVFSSTSKIVFVLTSNYSKCQSPRSSEHRLKRVSSGKNSRFLRRPKVYRCRRADHSSFQLVVRSPCTVEHL